MRTRTKRRAAQPSTELLGRSVAFDAIFAASDVAAIGAMHALQAIGRAVPRDVAIVGFDDIPAASLASPPLTTVTQDARQAGEALVEAIVASVEQGSAVNKRASGAADGAGVERFGLDGCAARARP